MWPSWAILSMSEPRCRFLLRRAIVCGHSGQVWLSRGHDQALSNWTAEAKGLSPRARGAQAAFQKYRELIAAQPHELPAKWVEC